MSDSKGVPASSASTRINGSKTPARSPNYERGRRVYLLVMIATVFLALLSDPFKLFQHLLPASLTAPWVWSRCRCLYGDPCWPSPAEFTELAKQLSQPLIHPRPPASVCYPPSDPSENCDAVVKGNQDGIWRAEQPGSMQNSNFETYIFPNGSISACYLNASLGIPCEQGSIPVIGVDARSVQDVQAAVNFATRHNLRLTVKNTGHDYLGRSAARGSFMIWTHHLKNITFHDHFTPTGSLTAEVFDNVLTLDAGVQWHEAYDAAYAHERVVVGGIAPGGSNGAAGGWLLGGGHSILSPTYGLGVDNAIQITVVISSGEHLTVNAHQHPDLFWALRGGGGGTYGVVTSVTYQTHPSTPLIGGYFSTTIDSPNAGPNAGPTPVLTKLVTELIRIMPELSDAGWAGYPTLEPNPVTGIPALSFLLVAHNTSWSKANESLNPFFEYARSLSASSSFDNGGALTVKSGFTAPVDSFKTWEKSWFRKIGLVGTNVILGSRLIPRDVIENNYTKLGEEIASYPGAGFYLVAGGAVSNVDPSSSAVHPAWRKAMLHTVFWGVWSEGASTADIKKVDDWVRLHVENLREIAPHSGAYFNEAYMDESDPQQTFFGPHYDQLRSIKDNYDRDGLFVVAKGVGHEKWDSALNCRV